MGGQQGCCGNIDVPQTLMQTTTVLCPSIPAHIRVPADVRCGPVDFFFVLPSGAATIAKASARIR